jgi:thymidylate synthase (FAD)
MDDVKRASVLVDGSAWRAEIMTPDEDLFRQLLCIEKAGRTCYQSERGIVDATSAAKFCRMLIGRGHESVLEHSHMTVKFYGCSRGMTHELVRHRLCAFSQESTRYVDYDDVLVMVPPPDQKGMGDAFARAVQASYDNYLLLRAACWPAQDARQVLPNALESEIVVTANFREWRHVFFMRCDPAAHWEIRRAMCALLESVKDILPGVFDDFVYIGKCQDMVDCYAKRMPRRVLARQLALCTHGECEDILSSSMEFRSEDERRADRAIRGRT